jgi:hypothetical protein
VTSVVDDWSVLGNEGSKEIPVTGAIYLNLQPHHEGRERMKTKMDLVFHSIAIIKCRLLE